MHTAIRTDLLRQVPVPRVQDICGYHSSVEDAAATAARAGARVLVLTHQVPALGPDDEHVWRQIAAQEFSGEIVVARDLTEVGV